MPLLRRYEQQKRNLLTFSTFVSVERTLAEVVNKILTNDVLLRLLYYTDKHALGLPALTQEQAFSMLNEQIKIVPKLKTDPDVKPYIIVTMNDFIPMPNQTTFRTATLSLDILAAYDHWILDDWKLRPYAIAGEVDGMLNNSFINSGMVEFVGAEMITLNEHLGGLSLYYNMETFFDDVQPQKLDWEKLRAVHAIN